MQSNRHNDSKKKIIDIKHNLKSMRAYEKWDTIREKEANFLLVNEKFTDALKRARTHLGIEDKEFNGDYQQVAHWLRGNAKISVTGDNDGAGLVKEPGYAQRTKLVVSTVLSIIDEFNLDMSWRKYIECCIASNGRPSDEAIVEMKLYLDVKDINERNEVIVTLKPGLSRKEYLEAWPLLSGVLGKPAKRTRKLLWAERDLAIYKGWASGMTYRQIAAEHFPNQEYDDTLKDKISKIIHRR